MSFRRRYIPRRWTSTIRAIAASEAAHQTISAGVEPADAENTKPQENQNHEDSEERKAVRELPAF